MSSIASDNSFEANVDVKAFSDNTLKAGLFNGDIQLNFSGKGAANAIGMLAIARHPEKLAEWREANAEGVARAYQAYREAMPWLNERQALLIAMGTPATPSEANNLFDVLEKAAKLLEERGGEPQEPSEAKAAKMIEGAKGSEEWAHDVWAKLIAGELETPGTFSKAAMATLDTMGFEDAALFDRLVSVCTGGFCVFADRSYEIIPYRTRGGLFGDCNLTNDDMIRLASFGLIDLAHYKNGTVSRKSGYSLVVHGELFVVTMFEKPGELKRGNCLLTPLGQELALLCDPGSHPGFLEFVRTDVERQGFKLEPVEAIIREEGHDRLNWQDVGRSESAETGDMEDRMGDFLEGSISLADDADIDGLF